MSDPFQFHPTVCGVTEGDIQNHPMVQLTKNKMTPFGKSSQLSGWYLDSLTHSLTKGSNNYLSETNNVPDTLLGSIFSASVPKGGFMAVSGPIGKISPMKASSQSKKSTDTLKSERDGESQIQGFFDNLKLSVEMAFPLVPNPAPADTSNSNPPGGLGWWKSQVLQRRAHFSLYLPKINPQFPCTAPVIPMT